MKKKVAKMVSCVLACATMAACALAGCGEKSGNAEPSIGEEQAANIPTLKDYDGQILKSGGVYAFTDKVAFMSTRSGTSSYEAMSVELVATVEPADANQDVNWQVAFKNGNSAWANGKAVSDYLTLDENADDSRRVTVTCLQPFGEQIVIECSAATNAEKKAECVVDFVQAPKNVALTFGEDLPINLGGETSVTWEINANGVGAGGAANVQADMYSTYTIADEYSWDIDLISPYYYENAMEYPEDNPTLDCWGEKRSTSGGDYAFEDYRFRAMNIGTALSGNCDLFLARQENITSWTLDYAFLQASELSAITETTMGGKTVRDIFLSSADTQKALGSITESTMYTLRLTYAGTYHTFEYLSLIKLEGYTNIAQVKSVSLSAGAQKF